MNVLLTGATGFIGRNLLAQLVPISDTIFLVEGKKRSLDTSQHVNVQSISRPSDLPRQFRINCVVHLATHFSVEEPPPLTRIVEANFSLGLELLELVRQDVPRFVVANSLWQLAPTTRGLAYTASKEAFARCAEVYAAVGQIELRQVFLPDTYGPLDDRPKLLNRMLSAALRKEHVKIVNPSARLHLVHIQDVIRGLMHVILDADQPPSTTVMPQRPISVRSLGEMVEEITNLSVMDLVDSGATELPDSLPMTCAANVPLVSSWRPTIGLGEGITQIWREMSRNKVAE